MPAISLVSRAIYVPSDQVDLVAGVGEPVLFEILAINDGNVDLDNVVISSDLFESGSGGCCSL